MIQVEEAEAIILALARDYGQETVPFEQALGRVLAEDLRTDRDLPPFNRVAMDGIAISYKGFARGCRSFTIKATQAAGEEPIAISDASECIEIMTGAALPPSTDTVIRYEDLEIQEGMALLQTESVKQGQNVHTRGQDKRAQDVVAQANQQITPALLGIASAVGATALPVKKLPKVVLISTGDELVPVHQQPLPHQIRQSNSYLVQAALQQYGLLPDLLHLPDDLDVTRSRLAECLQAYDVILMSGGISMGKFDYVPQALEELQVEKLFHKVKQRPGKPFWFGKHAGGTLIFALPGNPVSTFMCLHRFFQPWLRTCLGIAEQQTMRAVLSQDITFNPSLQYFLQVKISITEDARLQATPFAGNGSGDFSNLVEADAFLELPAARSVFKAGEVFRVWPFRRLFY